MPHLSPIMWASIYVILWVCLLGCLFSVESTKPSFIKNG